MIRFFKKHRPEYPDFWKAYEAKFSEKLPEFIDENEFELTNGETYRPGNKIAFKNPNKKQVIFKLHAENTHLSQGYSNISCNKYANVSYKGSVRFGTSNTSITDRFDGQAKITRVYAH